MLRCAQSSEHTSLRSHRRHPLAELGPHGPKAGDSGPLQPAEPGSDLRQGEAVLLDERVLGALALLDDLWVTISTRFNLFLLCPLVRLPHF